MFPTKKIFFSIWDLKPINIYTLYSQEKSYVFSMWNLKPLVYILYVPKKKVMFFQCGIKKILELNIISFYCEIKNFLKYSFKLHYLQFI